MPLMLILRVGILNPTALRITYYPHTHKSCLKNVYCNKEYFNIKYNSRIHRFCKTRSSEKISLVILRAFSKLKNV